MGDETNVFDELRKILGTSEAQDVGPRENAAFDALAGHDSTPTVPLTDVQKVRFTDLARELGVAKTDAYVEANVLVKLLEIAKLIIPIIAGGIGG